MQTNNKNSIMLVFIPSFAGVKFKESEIKTPNLFIKITVPHR
jgi:hypothetical protein